MHTTSKITNSLLLLAGDYDARLASRNMELVDLETLESHEIIVRDNHPGTRLFYQKSLDQNFSSTIIVRILSHWKPRTESVSNIFVLVPSAISDFIGTIGTVLVRWSLVSRKISEKLRLQHRFQFVIIPNKSLKPQKINLQFLNFPQKSPVKTDKITDNLVWWPKENCK